MPGWHDEAKRIPIASLSRAVFGRQLVGVGIAVLTAYLDASGSATDPGTFMLTIAGYIATDEQWSEFERAWQEALNAEGVSCFHMKDFAQSRGEFESWRGDEERRARFLGTLAKVVGEHTARDLSMSFHMEDYRLVDRKYELTESFPAYPLATSFVIGDAEKWMRTEHPNKPFLVVIEKGDNQQKKLVPFLKKMGYRLPSDPTFMRKKWTDEAGQTHFCLPFQACDFLVTCL